jgi:hypothetical protein
MLPLDILFVGMMKNSGHTERGVTNYKILNETCRPSSPGAAAPRTKSKM